MSSSRAKKELFQLAACEGHWQDRCSVERNSVQARPQRHEARGVLLMQMKSTKFQQDGVGEGRMIFLGQKVMEELRILARLARGTVIEQRTAARARRRITHQAGAEA